MTDTALTRTQGGGRMQWLDAMRGLTMTLVVAYHVAQIGFGQSEKISASLPFLALLRMPAFFFVSGFVAYKAGFQWTMPATLRLVWKKMRIQVIPAFVFLCVCLVLKKPHFWPAFTEAMASPTKGGYWFTWVLLHMFLIYYALCALARGRNWPVWLAWLLSVFVYATLYMPKEFTYHKDLFFSYSSLLFTFKFLQFFLLGNLVRRYWATVQRVMDSRWFFPLVALVATVCCLEFFRWHTLRFEWTNLPRTLAMYSLLCVLVMFFRHYENWFTRDRRLGRCMQHIGTHTLDIYILHFIFLPRLPMVGTWLDRYHPNFVVDLMASGSVALVIIAFCLLTSKVLSVSPILSKHLFGHKE